MKAQGTLIIIGGHEDHDGDRTILKEFAKRVQGDRVVLATVASHEPEGYLEKYEKSLGDLGISQVDELYVQERSEAMSSEKYDMLDGVSAVFFSGGDQLRITSQIGDTRLYRRVKKIYREGGVIAGTSAGASAMGEIMLAKGKSDSSHRLVDLHMAAGLGLVSNVIIDQHFAERGRIGRLIGAVAQNPRMLGIGIDEDTALVLQNNQFEVIGSGAVYIVDASRVSKTNLVEGDEDEALSVFGITMHILSQGDRFDLAHRMPEMHHQRET